jgi:hypothetical protein
MTFYEKYISLFNQFSMYALVDSSCPLFFPALSFGWYYYYFPQNVAKGKEINEMGGKNLYGIWLAALVKV